MKSKNVRRGIGVAICVLLVSAFARPALGESAFAHFDTIHNTDWTYAGLMGLRGVGSGAIPLSGVSGPVDRAILYWHGPTDSSDPAANADITFAGNAITGTHLGFAHDNGWGYDNSQAYRADVTPYVTGDALYAVDGLLKVGTADASGVSLLVFFDDGDDANNVSVALYDGNDSTEPDGWAATLPGIYSSDGTGRIVLGVSDGQLVTDGAISLNGSQLLPAGQIFSGDLLPDAGGTQGLWDIRSEDISAFLNPGMNTLDLAAAKGADFLSLVHLAVETPPIPEPCGVGLIGLALLAVRKKRR